MSDDLRRRNRPKRKKAGLSPVALVALIALPVLLLSCCGVLGVVVSLASGGVIGGRVGAAFALPNSRVTPENYAAVQNGHTLAQVEAILGVGRKPTDGDFDAVFGDERNGLRSPILDSRPGWELNDDRGLVRAWSSGRVRILITFTTPPERGGRVLMKLLVGRDGRVSMSSGGVPP